MADNEQVLRATLDTSGFTQGELNINVSITNIQQKLDELTRRTRETESSFGTLSEAAEALAGVMGALVGSFTVDKLIEVNSTYNRLSVEMNTVTGSAAGAKAAITELINFANTTPYTLDQVSDAFIRLRNAGLDASTGMLASLSNVASSMGRPIGDITDAIASAAVGNTEMLRGFGIEAQQAGDKITMTFQGISETINRSGPAIEQYIARLGNTTFEGDTDRQAQTISGRMMTYRDSIENLLRAVGDGGFNDAFKGMISDLTEADNKGIALAGTIGHTLGDAIQGTRDIWHQYGSEINAVAVGLGSVIAVGTGMRTLSMIFGAASLALNPVTLAIGAATTAVILFHDKTIDLGNGPTTVLQALKDGWRGLVDYIEEATAATLEFVHAQPKGDQQQRAASALDRTMAESWIPDPSPLIRGAVNAVGRGLRWGAGTLERRGQQDTEETATYSSGPTGLQPLPTLNAVGVPTSMVGSLPSTDLMLRPGLLSRQSSSYLTQHPEMLQTIQAAAARNNIPLNFFMRLLDLESGGLSDEHASAVSPTGAVGFGQIIPSTAANPGFSEEGLRPFRGNLTNPTDNINFAADYLAARARHEQGAGPIDWVRASRSYGTTSVEGNLGNLNRVTETSQDLTAALRMDAGKENQLYADNGVHANAQATGQVANLQMAIGPQSDYAPGFGARRALAQALIQAGYGTQINPNDPNSGMRAMTMDEVLGHVRNDNWTADNVQAFRQISAMAPAAYNSQTEHALSSAEQLGSYDRQANSLIALSKARELDTVQERARIQAIQEGLGPAEAARKSIQARADAENALAKSAAEAVQTARLQTQQTREQTQQISNQPMTWDNVSNSFIFDTRREDAQRLRDQMDPYHLRDDSLTTATQQANENWNQTRAAEQAQRTLSDTNAQNPLAGLKSGWSDFEDTFNNVNADMRKTFTDTMGGMNESMTSFIVTGTGNWKSFATSVISDITEMSIHYLESALFSSTGALGGVSSFFSGLMGSATSSWSTGPMMFASGGVTSGVSGYSGTVVDSPTRFVGSPGARYAEGASLMGEAGPEGVFPLKRGADGKLGVAVSGATGGATTIHMGGIAINNPNVTDGKMDEKTMSKLNSQLERTVQATVGRYLTNQQRPGGTLYGTTRTR